ncbi:serpin family protein [Georgenia sp. Z1344]|uniref:serpin family protein n=1 Tax=Georgenia sp. Z1344 TaxID=3416706 RepID=UPI003CF27B86
MSTRRRAVAAAAALPLLALAACGSGEPGTDDDAGSGDATGSSTAGPPGAPSDGAAPSDGPAGAGGATDLSPTGEPAGQPAPVALADATALDAHLAATAALGADVVAEVLADPDQDTLVVSPSSLATALAMVGAGSDGETRSEVEELLGSDVDGALEAIQALRAERADLDQDPATIVLDPLPDHAILHTANQVVLRDDVVPEQDWLDTVSHRLGAGVVATSSPDEMQDVLDEWVRLHTAELVEESGIDARADTVLVLQDAMLVASAWLDRFDEAATTDDGFTLAGGEVVEVPTMHAEAPLTYAEVDGHQATSLPLLDGLRLEVVLPGEGTAPAELTAQDWAAIADGLDGADQVALDLALPRADVETSFGLAPVLTELGAVELFGPTPDLSRMLPGDGYVIDQAVQQARLQIGEEGVVAAAVTEIAVAESGVAQPPERAEMIVDRPYAVRIVDGETGWVLVHGVIGDPRGEDG